MVELFHIAGSTIPSAIEIGGEPNAVVCQCASKPCEVALAFSGRMLPPKLGVLQGDRIAASRCLPAKSRLNALVPRRLDRRLERHAARGGRDRRTCQDQ